MPKKKDDSKIDVDNSGMEQLLKSFDNSGMEQLLKSFDNSGMEQLLKSFDNSGMEQLLKSFGSSPLAGETTKLLEELSSPDSEFNFDWSETDLSAWTNNDQASTPEPEPDPNLTTIDVSEWMLKQVQTNGFLHQREAAWHIRRYFGQRFIYLNKNDNPAISPDVLKEFLLVSLKSVVWNRRRRLWRCRQPSDPIKSRSVDA